MGDNNTTTVIRIPLRSPQKRTNPTNTRDLDGVKRFKGSRGLYKVALAKPSCVTNTLPIVPVGNNVETVVDTTQIEQNGIPKVIFVITELVRHELI